ncbi:MAG: epimerase [Hyphomonas sp. BRH_c22]|uniref:NAD-dependent epimerase/dehydratase family protein n=1 Tax=Hyphomonas sp. BRH_c22 TaxID=1629710 RepID=UPI0005F18311|nr:NAD-dependent epimerase/dehydratase family protein [Hyphomonas sp. BRH_c22]KJS35730.1 MAG: epimerase [Hyphomonas sp. BRH_c22]
MPSTVLVTGGTGFIGGWTIAELLKRGHKVRTTLRNPDKADWLLAQLSREVDPGDRLSFFKADLLSDDGWDAAVEGCDYVLHVAAPVGVDAPRNPDDLIIPTRDGALRVLKAACKANVKRVVLTSAIEACRPPLRSPDGVSDESLWTDTKDRGLGPYRIAKTLAERAAWDFMKSQSEPTSLTTILPAAVLGPVFSDQYPHASQLVQRMLLGKLPALPPVGFCVVDVRDVVDLNIRAMAAPEAAGERFIAASDWIWMADLAETLRSELGESASRVPTRRVPGFALRLMALRDRPAQFIAPLLGRKHVFSAAKAQAVLGWRPRSAAETVIDSARSAIAVGVV